MAVMIAFSVMAAVIAFYVRLKLGRSLSAASMA